MMEMKKKTTVRSVPDGSDNQEQDLIVPTLMHLLQNMKINLAELSNLLFGAFLIPQSGFQLNPSGL